MSEVKDALQVPDRATVAGWVTRDLDIVVSFINLVRNNPEVLNGLIDILHERIKADADLKSSEPELNFDGRE